MTPALKDLPPPKESEAAYRLGWCPTVGAEVFVRFRYAPGGDAVDGTTWIPMVVVGVSRLPTHATVAHMDDQNTYMHVHVRRVRPVL